MDSKVLASIRAGPTAWVCCWRDLDSVEGARGALMVLRLSVQSGHHTNATPIFHLKEITVALVMRLTPSHLRLPLFFSLSFCFSLGAQLGGSRLFDPLPLTLNGEIEEWGAST